MRGAECVLAALASAGIDPHAAGGTVTRVLSQSFGALDRREEYAAADVPMLPVVASDTRVAVQILAYGSAMVACSLLLVPVAGMTWVYAVITVAAGAWFLSGCVRLLTRARHPERGKLAAMKVFHASITYLTIVFVAVAVDPFLPL